MHLRATRSLVFCRSSRMTCPLMSPTPIKRASKANRAGLATVRIETNLRQGDLGVEVESVEGDLAETENSLAGDEASSEREGRQKSRVECPQMSCGRATARVDVPTAPRQCRGLFSFDSLSRLFLSIVETQKSAV